VGPVLESLVTLSSEYWGLLSEAGCCLSWVSISCRGGQCNRQRYHRCDSAASDRETVSRGRRLGKPVGRRLGKQMGRRLGSAMVTRSTCSKQNDRRPPHLAASFMSVFDDSTSA
jgi:hypothetical protein